jgi:tRNA nucleotidyltransferase (CCA-adding enzyme)
VPATGQLEDGCRAFIVGGAVRDQLRGLAATDRDWVVVGATVQGMLDAGFRPVGQDFPVFLHPLSHEEYALARTDRKSGQGYRGFVIHAAPDVTLEQDLARRDLTINAMAQDPATGEIIDPHAGQRDLRDKVLRHVSAAFVEDPVRLLRLARFAARFHDFSVAPQTLALLRSMVAGGEIDALVPERVWQELSRGLMEAHPSRMFEVLRECGALQRLLPQIEGGTQLLRVLDECARVDAPLSVRFACLGVGHSLPGEGQEAPHAALLQQMAQRLRVPAECLDLAELFARECRHLQHSGELDAEASVTLLERCDAFRRPDRFARLLQACDCEAHARGDRLSDANAQRTRWLQTLARARNIDATWVAAQAAAQGLRGPAIGRALHHARVRALAAQG